MNKKTTQAFAQWGIINSLWLAVVIASHYYSAFKTIIEVFIPFFILTDVLILASKTIREELLDTHWRPLIVPLELDALYDAIIVGLLLKFGWWFLAIEYCLYAVLCFRSHIKLENEFFARQFK